jgi:hypothetical protein
MNRSLDELPRRGPLVGLLAHERLDVTAVAAAVFAGLNTLLATVVAVSAGFLLGVFDLLVSAVEGLLAGLKAVPRLAGGLANLLRLVVGIRFVFDRFALLQRSARYVGAYLFRGAFMRWLFKFFPILKIFNIGRLLAFFQIRLTSLVTSFNFYLFHFLKLVDDLAGGLLALAVELDQRLAFGQLVVELRIPHRHLDELDAIAHDPLQTHLSTFGRDGRGPYPGHAASGD